MGRWVVILLTLAACTADSVSDATFVVRDSAGVRIVENHRAAWSDDDAWRIALEPTVKLGLVEGDSAYQFFGIQAIELLRDTSMLVLDGGSSELRRYDARGGHLWSAGGKGSGPGQFERPVLLGQQTDGVCLIWDRSLSRMTLIDSAGELIDSRPYSPQNGPSPIPYDLFDVGTLLVTYPDIVRPPAAGAVLADTIDFWRLDLATSEQNPITELPGPVWVWTNQRIARARRSCASSLSTWWCSAALPIRMPGGSSRTSRWARRIRSWQG